MKPALVPVPHAPAAPVSRAFAVALRAALFAILWWIVAGGDPGSWVIGLPMVALATWASLSLAGHGRPRLALWTAVSFVPFFLWESFRGGLDVASRVFVTPVRIHPGFRHFDLRLPPGPGRVFFVNCVSLLPGTLSTEVEGDRFIVHVLDDRADMAGELRTLERRVIELFGTAPAGEPR